MRLFAVAALLSAAPLFAQGTCTYVLSSTSVTVPGNGSYTGTISVSQTAGSSCPSFTATSQFNWIHIQDKGTLSVPAVVSFTVDANQTANPRTGAMSIANQTVTITQTGANCAFSINPKTQNVGVDGGTGSFAIQANCAWNAQSSVNWLSFPAVSQGQSDGTITFAADRNPCVPSRTGTITVLTALPIPPTFTVVQDGAAGNLTLSASSATASSAASDTRITVTTGDGCAWNAFSDVTWMQITNGTAGSGNGGIVYHLVENKSNAVRVGSIHVGPVTYTVTQQPPAVPAPVLNSVANAANYNADAVSPGEIVTLFGVNLGPATIVTLQLDDKGAVTKTLGGTQVFFDDVAAPMVYTLAGQVSAVVPYGLAGKSSTKVLVQYQGVASNTVTMAVQGAHPAIFSIDSTGIGPGAILNEDNSVNATGKPAAKGSIIAIFLTGGGATTPLSVDGAVTGTPPLLSLPVTVTIGGVQAVVKYAGAAPQAIAGLTQINVEVPSGVNAAIALPVVIKIGDFTGTGSVTVAVK